MSEKPKQLRKWSVTFTLTNGTKVTREQEGTSETEAIEKCWEGLLRDFPSAASYAAHKAEILPEEPARDMKSL